MHLITNSMKQLFIPKLRGCIREYSKSEDLRIEGHKDEDKDKNHKDHKIKKRLYQILYSNVKANKSIPLN